MQRLVFAPAVLALAIYAPGCGFDAQAQISTEGQEMLPEPDKEAAVRSEYARVQAKATREAYERFIRRHPGHPLAERAREALAQDELK